MQQQCRIVISSKCHKLWFVANNMKTKINGQIDQNHFCLWFIWYLIEIWNEFLLVVDKSGTLLDIETFTIPMKINTRQIITHLCNEKWKQKKTDKSHHKWQSLNSVTLQCLRVRCFYGTIKMCDGDVDIFHDSITHHHKLYIWCDFCCCCWTFCTKLPCKLRPEKQEYAWNQLGFILKNVTKYSITFSWKQRIERKKTCFMFIPCSTFDFPSTIFSSVNPFCTVFFPPFHWKHDGRIFFFFEQGKTCNG